MDLFRKQQLTSQVPRNLGPNEASEGIPSHILSTQDCSSLLHREDTVVVASLSSIPNSHVLGGFSSWQSSASGRRVYIFLNSPWRIPSMSCICWNYFWRKLMQTPGFMLYCKGGLNHSCKILLSPVWWFSNMALLLVSQGKAIENRTIICLTPPVSKGREANMRLSHLREQRTPQKKFCVSASCATLCMSQREYDESLYCCIQP